MKECTYLYLSSIATTADLALSPLLCLLMLSTALVVLGRASSIGPEAKSSGRSSSIPRMSMKTWLQPGTEEILTEDILVEEPITPSLCRFPLYVSLGGNLFWRHSISHEGGEKVEDTLLRLGFQDVLRHPHKLFLDLITNTHPRCHPLTTPEEVHLASFQDLISLIISENNPEGVRERRLEVNQDPAEASEVKIRDILFHQTHQEIDGSDIVCGGLAIESDPRTGYIYNNNQPGMSFNCE